MIPIWVVSGLLSDIAKLTAGGSCMYTTSCKTFYIHPQSYNDFLKSFNIICNLSGSFQDSVQPLINLSTLSKAVINLLYSSQPPKNISRPLNASQNALTSLYNLLETSHYNLSGSFLHSCKYSQ